jgi:hypothetical protein
VPIDSTTIKIDGKDYDLTRLPPRPTPEQLAAKAASASSAASAASAAGAASAGNPAASGSAAAGASAGKPTSSASAGEPASGSSAGAAASGDEDQGPVPGKLDKQNQLIVNDNVRAVMMPGREVLEATWTGEAGIPLVRLALQAYAGTHGYDFNETEQRMYDELASPADTPDQDQIYRVFLPVTNAPAQTPEQISGRAEPLAALDPSIWTGKAPESKNGEGDKNKKSEGRKPPAHAKKRHRG